MTNVLLIFICIIAGYCLKKTPFFDENSSSVLNRLIIYFFIPLIAIYQVPRIDFELNLIWLTLSPFLIFGLSFLFFQIISPLFSIQKETKAALILTSGISSTSFVGFPIFEMLYGDEGLAYGILLSLGGTILVFNTVGISTLFYYSEGESSIKSTLKKVITFIPFVAFIIALFFNLLQITYPPIIENLLARLVAPFSIIALLSIGMQVELKISKSIFKELILGQFFKLCLAPLAIFILLWVCLDIKDVIGKVCILGAAIGSMNAMSILTAEKGLNPKLSILMPAIGIPLSIPILLLIDTLLK